MSPAKPPPPPSRAKSDGDADVGRNVLIGTSIGAGIALLILMLLLLLWLFTREHRSGDGAATGPIAKGSGGGSGGGEGTGAGRGKGTGAGSGTSAGAGPGESAAEGEANQEPVEAESPAGGSSAPPRESNGNSDGDSTKDAPPASNYAINSVAPPPAAPASDEDTPGSGGGGGGGGGGGSGGSEFFGVKSKGNRFVYIVDCSGSMSGPPFSKACQELLDSIHRLRSSQSVYVFFFADIAYPMFFPQPPEDKLLRASEKNLKKIDMWIRQFNGFGGTNPREALLQALELKPDSIFLLTDGEFYAPIVDEVTQRNQKKVVINTIGFMNLAGEPLLKKLAEDNRGKYRFIP